MNHKSCPFEIKAFDDSAGTVTALISAFGNVDLVGDRVKRTAFDNTIRAWQRKGDPVPMVLSHRWDDVMSHIGTGDPERIKATDEGLLVEEAAVDLDNPIALQTYKLMKRRSLTAFSFGYTVVEEKVDKDGVNDLIELDLIEFGPTLKGANPDAQLQAVKSAIQQSSTRRDQEPPAKSQIAAVRRQIQRSRIASRTHPGGQA